MYENGGSFAEGYAIGRDSNNGYNNGGWGFGGDWIWAFLLLALAGNGGWGFGGGFGGGYGGGNLAGYEIGRLATTNDVASGFSTSAMMGNLNDIILGQAGIQQTLCQGFSGVNQTVERGLSTLGYNMATGFHGVDNAICTLGYQTQQGFNGIANQIASCCCDLKTMNLENRYLNEKQTCDIITAINAGNQRLVDIYTGDKIAALQAENTALKGQISNSKQTAEIISQLRDPSCPIASYAVPNPNCCYNPLFTGFGGGNCGCN
jgi:hypothetical protein